MSGYSEKQHEMPTPREGRRRALRDLLVSAADTARQTRQSVMSATLDRAVPQALRERISSFLSTAR